VIGWLRLGLFRDNFITLTYGLPLLICLWYPNRRLLWAMAGTFVAMAAFKAFVLMPAGGVNEIHPLVQFGMQLTNIVIIGAAIQAIINLTARLQAKNLELEARDEEISRQNEELQAQNEELTAQNEKIQQQSEEIQQQSEEVQAQAEELQAINEELAKQHAVLETLFASLQSPLDPPQGPEGICEALLAMFGGRAAAVVIVEKKGNQMSVLSHTKGLEPTPSRWAYAGSFCEIVLEHNRTAVVADLARRPDLLVPRSSNKAYRSIVGTPLRLGPNSVGVIEVLAEEPREWTATEFKLLEWASTQCSLVLEIRRLQSELLKANADLERAVKDRTAELQETVHELEHFSYTITHDMRAPLRAMQGYAELLMAEYSRLLDSAGHEYLQRIVNAARRMDGLITDALSFSKAIRTEMHTAPVDAGALIRGMINSYPLFQPPRARIEVASDIPPVLGNEAGLTQCLSNLLGNAVKFVPKDRVPHVRVYSEHQDGMVRLWVEDNGIGIPPPMQPRLFGMFQRLSKDYEGTGIGLALVKKVVNRMGGRVGVQSEPGKGSRFWLELKRA
jgi:signal transduction histidine kinase